MNSKIILRQKYIDAVVPYCNTKLIKVLVGQRRVGKSYILQQIMSYVQSHFSHAHIIYINKEDIQFETIQTAHDLYTYITEHAHAEHTNYVFIDEIQEISDFQKALRSILLKDNFDVYCTGSNAYMLSGEISTMLSGRYIEIPVHSLSFVEFCQFHALEHSNENFQKYMQFGGMPYLINIELSHEIVYNYLKGVYSTIMYRDILLRNEVRNTAFLENLVRFLADNTGQLFSAKKISDYLKSQNISIATSQILSYTQHLCNAFLIHKVPRIDVVGKKIFEIGEKYYFADIGLRHAIFEYKQADISKILENVVYNHLLHCNYEVFIGHHQNFEIDFVARKKGEYLYVQVCYLLHDKSTIEREFGNLEKITNNYPKMVVSMDSFAGNTRNGIQHMHIVDFVTREL
jgi:predicted AAA+ superfamily ATPase